jgi:hypothetical protein
MDHADQTPGTIRELMARATTMMTKQAIDLAKILSKTATIERAARPFSAEPSSRSGVFQNAETISRTQAFRAGEFCETFGTVDANVIHFEN